MKRNSILLMALTLAVLALSPAQSQAYKLRVMSFNIRLLTKADAPYNLWQDRCDPLCAYVKSVKADVFGMQEVKKQQLDNVMSRVPGYSYVGVGRDDGHEGGEYSPVFYRTDKFNLIDKGWFWLSETPDQPSFGWNAACRRIASWAILEDKKKKTRFFVCNTHFDHISVTARKESAKLCKEKFQSIAKGLPTFFTADFNTNESEETYNLLCSYSYLYNDTWHVAKRKKGGPATFNGWGTCENVASHKIDFIFASPKVKVKRAVINDSRIDSVRFLTDHNALWVDCSWR